jgi:DNA-binding MarR family transcriptional regulator
MESPPVTALEDRDIERLAALRAGMRRYLAWAEERAREHGTTPTQFQLMLAVRASGDPPGPTVSELADTLQLRHHSAVGLIDRAEAAGLVQRSRDAVHAARVHVRLTTLGSARLQELTELHLVEVRQLAQEMQALWSTFAEPGRSPPP